MKDYLVSIKVKSKLAVDVLAEALNVGVEVNDGKVTLSGVVDNYAQKDHLEKEVKEVEGVREIENQITVGANEPLTIHIEAIYGNLSDEEMQQTKDQIKQILAHQMHLEEDDVDVEINRTGTVKLSGDIISTATKRRIETLIWTVPKVSWIVNQIKCQEEEELDSSEPDKMHSAIAGTKLNAYLLREGLISDALRIGTHVVDDKIILKGDVYNVAVKEKIFECARELFEEYEIENDITLAENIDIEEKMDSLDDLSQRIAATYPIHAAEYPYTPAFPSHPIWKLTEKNIKETTEDLQEKINSEAEKVTCKVDGFGNAYLSGEVETYNQLKKIEDIAWDTRGVHYVINGVKLKS